MRITVFTPAYNRGYIIEKLYRSLQNQTFRNFEWLIIDDGSSDNTSEKIQSFIQDNNDFPIILKSRKWRKTPGNQSRSSKSQGRTVLYRRF